jgi:protein-disulfide isomerase
MRPATAAAGLVVVGLAGFLAGRVWPTSTESVRRYLENHPAFLVNHPELIEAARPIAVARIEADAVARRRSLVQEAALHGVLGQSTPRWGLAESPLAMIEFTDYGCMPCKAMAAAVEYAAASNPDRQVLLVYLPLDGASEFAARAGLAAWAQDRQKFRRFHRELMRLADGTSPLAVEAAARQAGLDLEALRDAIASLEVRQHLAELRDFATRAGIRGLPSVVLANGTLVSGPMTAERLDTLLRGSPAGLR